MKILHIVPSYHPAFFYGGPIYSVHLLNKTLVEKGIDVTVYTTNRNGPETLNVPLGTPVDVDGVRVFYFSTSFPKSWFYSKELCHMLKHTVKEFDLIHITSVFLSASFFGARYAQKAGTPYIISPRGSLMKEPLIKSSSKKSLYIRFLERRNLLGAAAIHFTAHKEKEEYIKRGLPFKKSFVIPNGIELLGNQHVQQGAFHKRFGIATSKKLVLYHGRLGWKKGFDTLIPAFKRVVKKEPNAVLVIAAWSDEGYKTTLQRLIEKHNLESNVLLIDRLDGVLRAEAFAGASVFILTSYSENFGVGVVQAMEAGVPVIVTDGVAISSDIAKAEVGVVVPKRVDTVADAIVQILASESDARAMGERARLFVQKQYGSQKIADLFIKEYSELIQA